MHAQCVREVMAFVRGERVGLSRLRCVLPSILREFPSTDPVAVLADCGLTPLHTGKVPSFYFHPEKDGHAMIVPEHRRDVVLAERLIVFAPEEPVPASDRLLLAYADLSSTWTVAR